MPLVSIEFTLCFLVFFGIYWLFIDRVKVQNILLVMAGILFMLSWNWQFLINIVSVWLVTELTLVLLQSVSKKIYKRTVMQLGTAALVVHLFLYKYMSFGIEEYNALTASDVTPITLILPLGLSFYTFQAISYIVDFYQGKTEKIPRLVLFGVFSAFSTITAGPIFRPTDASTQWQKPREIISPYIAFVLIIFAVIKKVVLAGWLADIWVGPIFSNPLQYHALEVLTGIYGYALQLFFDFSGYTDLVLAMGLLLGFKLPANFNAPYLAKNIRCFWQRWHISLSTWIRDYLYIPLGGSRGSWLRTQFNLLVAFVLSGMWHGAGWNFFIWGAIHGLALVWLNLCQKLKLPKLSDYAPWLSVFITFHYVCFGWIFFHSTSIEQVLEIFTAMFNIGSLDTITLPVYSTLVVMMLTWIVYPKITDIKHRLVSVLEHLPWWILPLPFALTLIVVFSFAPTGLPGFIYANF